MQEQFSSSSLSLKIQNRSIEIEDLLQTESDHVVLVVARDRESVRIDFTSSRYSFGGRSCSRLEAGRDRMTPRCSRLRRTRIQSSFPEECCLVLESFFASNDFFHQINNGFLLIADFVICIATLLILKLSDQNSCISRTRVEQNPRRDTSARGVQPPEQYQDMLRNFSYENQRSINQTQTQKIIVRDKSRAYGKELMRQNQLTPFSAR